MIHQEQNHGIPDPISNGNGNGHHNGVAPDLADTDVMLDAEHDEYARQILAQQGDALTPQDFTLVRVKAVGKHMFVQQPLTVDRFHDWITNPGLPLAEKTSAIRRFLTPDGKKTPPFNTKKRKLLPSVLPAVHAPVGTPVAEMPGQYHNGLYPYDIDVGDCDWAALKEEIAALPSVLLVAYSSSLNGLYAFVAGTRAETPEEYTARWPQCRELFPPHIRDATAKNTTEINRNRFCCHDADAYLAESVIPMHLDAQAGEGETREAAQAMPLTGVADTGDEEGMIDADWILHGITCENDSTFAAKWGAIFGFARPNLSDQSDSAYDAALAATLAAAGWGEPEEEEEENGEWDIGPIHRALLELRRTARKAGRPVKDKHPGYFARTIRNAIQFVLSGRERNEKAGAPAHQDNGNGHSGGAAGVIDYPDYYPAAEVLEEAAHDARHAFEPVIEVQRLPDPDYGYLIVHLGAVTHHIGRVALSNPRPRLPDDLKGLAGFIATRLGEAYLTQLNEPLELWRPGDPAPPPPGWAAAPLMLDTGVSLIYGANGSGKSMLSISTAIALASRRDVNGVKPGKPGRVLYLDAEDSVGTFNWRAQQMCQAAGIDWNGDLPLFYHSTNRLLPEIEAGLERAIQENGIDYIIADSLSKLMSDAIAQPVINAVFAVCSRLGVPLLFVTHSPKGAPGELYGGRAISGNARLVTCIETPDAEESLSIQTWRAVKVNSIKRPTDRTAVWTIDDSGISATVSDGIATPEAEKEALRGKICNLLAERGELTRSDIAAALKATKDQTNLAVRALLDEGTLDDGGKRQGPVSLRVEAHVIGNPGGSTDSAASWLDC